MPKPKIKIKTLKLAAVSSAMVLALSFGSSVLAMKSVPQDWLGALDVLDVSDQIVYLDSIKELRITDYELRKAAAELLDASESFSVIPDATSAARAILNLTLSKIPDYSTSPRFGDGPKVVVRPFTCSPAFACEGRQVGADYQLPDLKSLLAQAWDRVSRITYHVSEPQVAGISQPIPAEDFDPSPIPAEDEASRAEILQKPYKDPRLPDPTLSSGMGGGNVSNSASGMGNSTQATTIIREIHNYTLQASLTAEELTALLTTNSQLTTLLKGEKGERGETGPQGPQGSQGPSGSGFVYIAPTASNTSPGSVGGVTYFGAKELTTQTLTATGLATLDTLTVNNGTTFEGSLTLGDGGDTVAINSSDWDISTTGSITNATYEGLTITTTTGTLTITDAKTLTVSNILTFTGTDSSTVAFGAGGTVTYTTDKLSVFAATTSAELDGVISDDTGSGALVFADTPTLVTPVLGAATATSIAIGANILDTNEWANLDGVNQTLATTSSPTFAGLALGTGSLTMTGSLGTTGARLTKGWFTDLEVTNAIAGSITGNAATVTNATLTTA